MRSFTLTRDVPRPAPAGQAGVWITAVLVASLWLDTLRVTPAPPAAAHSWLVALAGLATQLAFTAGEAGLACLAWRLVGSRPGWRALAPRLLIASSAETLALAIASGRTALPHAVAVALAGPRATSATGATSGLGFAFASAGALTLARLALSAHLQAGAARARFRRALAVVTGLWLVSRLLMWWTFDLMEGRSFRS